MRTTRETKENDFYKEALMRQLYDAGWDVAYEDLTGDWYIQYYTTEKQDKEFEAWFLMEYRKRFKASKTMAKNCYSAFILGYGLTIK